MSTQGVLQQAGGGNRTEAQMQAIGTASGAYTSCNGTTNEAAVMKQAGIPASTKSKPSLEDISAALREGKAVIVGLDARPIWAQASPAPLGHAIRVTGVELDSAGKPAAVFINDTGTGIAGQRVPEVTFRSAMKGFGGGRMTTSDNPVP